MPPKDRSIPDHEILGSWKFLGYTPTSCAPVEKCETEYITLTKNPDEELFPFRAVVMKETKSGDCTIQELA